MAVRFQSANSVSDSTLRNLITLPVRVLLDGVEWVLFEVLARIGAWPIKLPLAVWMHIKLTRLEMSSRLEQERARNAGRVLAAAIDAQTAPFAQALAQIQQLDVQHAQMNPHFEEVLVASQAVFESAIRQIEDVTASKALHDKLLNDLRTL